MEDFMRQRVTRLAPLIALAALAIAIGPERFEKLQGPARWMLLGCFTLAFITPILLAGRSRKSPPSVVPLSGIGRALWRSMLIFNAAACVVGCMAVILFHTVVPVQYLIIAPVVNLLLAVAVWKVLRCR